MSDLFIIVHCEATKESPKVWDEIKRIKKKEKYMLVNGAAAKVEYKIPPNIERIFVCGAYHGKQSWDPRCVDEQIKALRRKGYSQELYLPATISLDP